MIRPVTCLTMLVAAGSGLYLYQAKHQGYVLDRQIEQVASAAGRIREHISVLRAEYALLNDPSRLQDLAGTHLPHLAPLAPGQFTSLAQLDQRLPPVAAPPASVAAPPDAPATPPVIGVSTGHAPYRFPTRPGAAGRPAGDPWAGRQRVGPTPNRRVANHPPLPAGQLRIRRLRSRRLRQRDPSRSAAPRRHLRGGPAA